MKGPPRRARLARAALAGMLLAAAAQAEDWQLPEELQGDLTALEQEQQVFITSGAALQFLPARQLQHEIATRDADSLGRFVEDLMQVAGEMGYDPERDMGAIPLNLTSERFNQTIPTPAPLRELERAPGPFGVHRYLFPESGIPTFAGAPVAIFPEDLVAGNVDVAIIGIPNDMSSGRRNAGHGPRVMRALDTIATLDAQTLLNPLEVLSVVDYGDFSVDNMSTTRTIDHVTAMVAETTATGAVPMMVGGDTSMLYPGVKGVAQHHGHGSFGLAHFSAHADVHRQAVHPVSDTQAIFLLLNEGLVSGDAMVQIGLRGDAATQANLQWLRDQGVRYHTMASVRRHGFEATLERMLREVEQGPEKLFVSIDVSVMEPTDMVAAGRIAANGLRVQEVAGAIRHLCAAREIVGFEITDMSPMLDVSRLSAMNANTILNACLVGMAVRASGYGPDHIHPLALHHEQD